MNKFKSKKGFTLAELLIVVAIIAVLVAIAVPLFVSGLERAQKARDDANVRAVKSAAEVIILSDEKTYWDGDPDTDGLQTPAGWKIVATIEKGGNIKIVKTSGITALKDKTAISEVTESVAWSGEECTITTVLLPTELSES